MECLECESTDFEKREMRFSPEIKGEKIDVIVPSFVCEKCGSTLMDTQQMNGLRRESADQYRRSKKLLMWSRQAMCVMLARVYTEKVFVSPSPEAGASRFALICRP